MGCDGVGEVEGMGSNRWAGDEGKEEPGKERSQRIEKRWMNRHDGSGHR